MNAEAAQRARDTAYMYYCARPVRTNKAAVADTDTDTDAEEAPKE